MKNIERLPDCYRKDSVSNNYKLLELNESAVKELRQDIESVWNALDLSQATGKTLELYGYMLEQLRGPLTDEQYRHMLLAKIGRNYVKGDYQSIMDALVMMFGARPEQIKASDFELIEGDKPCLVKLTRYPDVLEEAGFTIRQMAQMIKALLPICITLLLQFYSWYEVHIHYDNAIHFQTSFHPRYNLPFLHLDRLWNLDNGRRVNGYDSGDVLDFYPVGMRMQSGIRAIILTEQRVQTTWANPVDVGTESICGIRTAAKQDIRTAKQLTITTGAAEPVVIHSGAEFVAGVRLDIKAVENVQCQTAAAVNVRSEEQYALRNESGQDIDTACYMTKMNQMNQEWKLDGSRKMDGGRYVL